LVADAANRAQGDGVEVEHIAREDPLGLRLEELPQVGPACRGAGSIPAVFRIFQTLEAPIR
jgi:hypothetical protein